MVKKRKTFSLEALKNKVNEVVLSQEISEEYKAGWCEAYTYAAIVANNYNGFAFVNVDGTPVLTDVPRPHEAGYFQRKYY